MSTGITEFLNELNEAESLIALRSAHSQKSHFVFKVEEHPNPIITSIDNFLDKRAILTTEVKDIKISDAKEVSMKFNVGTEIYFVKAHIKSHLNRYYFDMSSKVIQLKRRKEPRFLIPKKWTQSAGIFIAPPKIETLKCNVVDISLSGIRFEVPERCPVLKRDDIIQIKFQIYKRGEVTLKAIVRFALLRPNMPAILGLEFTADTPHVQKERVAHIVEDINMFNSLNK